MLSEEEKKAIEFIKFYQQHCLKKEIENMKQYETVNDGEFISKKLDTVLNLITRLKKENEENKYLYQRALGDVVSADKENIELKKQIDLMAEFINKQDIDEEICKNNISDLCDEFGTGINCIKCIKQYFEGKAKEMRNNEFCSQRNYTLWRMW